MLISCPECGELISDKASSCPHCGLPEEDIIKESAKEMLEDLRARGKRESELQHCSFCRANLEPKPANQFEVRWDQCRKCSSLFCRKHGTVIRRHGNSETHYWIRCQDHLPEKSAWGVVCSLLLANGGLGELEEPDVKYESDWEDCY